MKKRTGMPYGMICKTLQLPLASFNRWRCRMRENVVFIKPPGPKKVEPFDPSVLDTEIRLLDHGVKRSAGTTELYRRYRFSVSRRELAWMVEWVRQDLEADRRAHLRRIEWLRPGILWAMDFTEYDLSPAGKIYLEGAWVRLAKLTFGAIHKKVGPASLEMKMGRTGDGGIGRQKR